MAMAVVYTPFSEISNGKNSWNIIAKVIRMWVVSDFVKHKIPFSLEMVLLDQEGNRIHAYVKRTLVYKFVNDIKEGSVYSIENLAVAPNVGSFRTNRHAWKLMFQFTSKVQIMGGDHVHGEAYELVPISQLTVPDVDTDYLVDVVGLLTGVGTKRQIERNGVKTKLNVISLEEDGHKIECTLFGPYVDELNAFLASGEVENAVVILQFAKVKLFQEKINLQNCMSCTKLIFNPTCQAAVKLRQRMSATLESPTQGLSQLSEPTKISLEEEFIQLTPGTTVAGLKHLDEEGLFVVYATITDIVTGTWWYTSCVCSKAVFPDSDMYFCEKCYKHVMKVVPRYCIKVCVGDVTGDTVFVIFDNVGRVLLNRTAAELFEAEDKISGNHAIPEEICNLKGKTFLFKVELKKQSNSLFGQSFRVKKICADESIIQKFKDEMNKPLDLSPVSGFVSDGKEKMIEGSSKSISEDLLPKFLTAGIEECSQTVEGKGKDVQVVEEEVTKLSNDEVVTPVKNVVVSADSQVELVTPLSIGSASQVPIDLDNDMDPFTPLKRVSPSEIEKADDHVPLKMLKKTIKIEKD